MSVIEGTISVSAGGGVHFDPAPSPGGASRPVEFGSGLTNGGMGKDSAGAGRSNPGGCGFHKASTQNSPECPTGAIVTRPFLQLVAQRPATTQPSRQVQGPDKAGVGRSSANSRIVIILPRLARALNQPLIAIVLAVLLIVIGVLGLVSDDIKHGYAIGIIVIGVLNLIRAQPKAEEEEPSSTSSTG